MANTKSIRDWKSDKNSITFSGKKLFLTDSGKWENEIGYLYARILMMTMMIGSTSSSSSSSRTKAHAIPESMCVCFDSIH